MAVLKCLNPKCGTETSYKGRKTVSCPKCGNQYAVRVK